MIISNENKLVTLINVFEVEPAHQQELIATWIDFRKTVENEPGFLGAALHRSLDGTRVLNYAQWEQSADWQRFAQKFGQDFARFQPLSTRIDPHLYEVVDLTERSV